MLIRRFRKTMNEDFGEPGWLMEGAPSTYFPIGGLAVAHDIMEHRPGDEGTVKDELLAFGAMVYLRGEGGYWHQRGRARTSPGDQIGGELASDLGIKYGGIADGVPDPGRTLKLEEHVEEWLAQAIQVARTELHAHGHDFSPNQINEFFTHAVGWMRRGYRAARKRYTNSSPSYLTDLFMQIEDRADNLLKEDMADYCPMVVQVDLVRHRVNVFLDESGLDEDYYN